MLRVKFLTTTFLFSSRERLGLVAVIVESICRFHRLPREKKNYTRQKLTNESRCFKLNYASTTKNSLSFNVPSEYDPEYYTCNRGTKR